VTVPRSGRPTIADVAAAARVSRATVSRVLNGNDTVDPALARRVRTASQRLGYQVNLTALGLARGVTGVCGVIVPDLVNPFFPELLKGIEAAADADGYRVIVADSDEDPAREARLVDELARRCDALILCSSRMDVGTMGDVVRGGTPVVLANRVESRLGVSAAAIDIEPAIAAIVEHLAALGHRRVGYVAGPSLSWSDGRRASALRSATRKRSMELVSRPAGSSTDSGYTAAGSLIESGVSAVVAFNDLVALGVVARLRASGLDTPGDVSVIGFDDIPAAAFAAPALSTVRFPKAELGRAAWSLLRDRLAGRTPEVRWLAAELVLRGSTAVANDERTVTRPSS